MEAHQNEMAKHYKQMLATSNKLYRGFQLLSWVKQILLEVGSDKYCWLGINCEGFSPSLPAIFSDTDTHKMLDFNCLEM